MVVLAAVIARSGHLRTLERLLARYPVVAILGPRQVGKTTLADQVAERFDGPVTRFDCEDPRDLGRLRDPLLALEGLRGLVVVDEVQLRPELFPVLRVLADRRSEPARFLILGSASPHLLQQSSETLAGRIAFHRLNGFSLRETGAGHADELWFRGAFPRSYLAADTEDSLEWRRHLVQTFVERDLPQFGIDLPPLTVRRFWTMIAHWHGQVWNASEFARAFGVSDATVRRYLDKLVSTFAVRRLEPWHENLAKRQVKSPKVYVADSGLLHTLLAIETPEDLAGHPKVGASFEGFAGDVVVDALGARPEECYFWRTHQGAEIDLLVVRGRRRLGFEFKRTVAPTVTRSMHIALEDLRLERLDVVHVGDETFPLGPKIRGVGLSRVLKDVEPLR